MKNKEKYIMIGKCLYFQKLEILCVGDLHLGYEQMLNDNGLQFSLEQFVEMSEELIKTISTVKKSGKKIREIIFLGDIKHYFGFSKEEKQNIMKLIRFLNNLGIKEHQIRFIRGNHEKNLKNKKFLDFYIVKDVAFIHGDREFNEIYEKDIGLVVMGHIHPTVTLSDKMNVKKEKYKCFLAGKYKKKQFLIVPSFLSITNGVSLTEYDDKKTKGYDFSIVPQKKLDDFEVFVVNNNLDEKALSFGKLKDLTN